MVKRLQDSLPPAITADLPLGKSFFFAFLKLAARGELSWPAASGTFHRAGAGRQ